MRKISFSADYGYSDLADASAVDELLLLFVDCVDNEYCLDFLGCFIDYPTTSVLIDYFISKLSGNNRKLIVLTDLLLPEDILLKLLFIGSKYVVVEKSEVSVVDCVKLSSRENNMCITVKVYGQENNIIREYLYG
ncbi:MAG: hypothetical protein FJ150_08505 [Euryarchaeota archaeon]|nr:hypothetical protein [Euryarchaeota archaeon]